MVKEGFIPRSSDGLMTELTSKSMLDSLGFHELKELRDEASRRIRLEINKNSLRLQVYIAAGIREDFDTAVQWAYDRKLIKKPSKWMFCKMAVHNAVLYIMEQKKTEELEKARAAAAISSQFVSGAQIPGQHTQDQSKTA